MRFTPPRIVAIGATVAAAALALAACSSTTSSGTGGGATSGASGAKVNLASVCPSDVVVQTDWNPEADHGQLYQMLGPGYTVDTKTKSVTGPLYANGKSTGVKITIKAGGPAIGYSTVSQQMYTDKTITMGYVDTDEAVEFSNKFPTEAVFAETNHSPLVAIWDPATYPNVTDMKSLGTALKASGGVLRTFSGVAYIPYLESFGYLPASVVTPTYDGTVLKFAAAKGKDASQGFATAEPYIWSNETAAWNKPLKYALVYKSGYDIYPEPLSVRSADLTKLTPCLKKLVPVMQQADVNYIKSPSATNTLITSLVNQYNNGWVYDDKVGAAAVKTMKSLGLVGNGPDGYVGEMEASRVQKIIDVDTPTYTKTGSAPKTGLTPDDLYTNKFLSKSIKF